MSVAVADHVVLVAQDPSTVGLIASAVDDSDSCAVLPVADAPTAYAALTEQRCSAVIVEVATNEELVAELLEDVHGPAVIGVCTDEDHARAFLARGGYDAIVPTAPSAVRDARRAIAHAIERERARVALRDERARSVARRGQSMAGFFELAPDTAPIRVDDLAHELTGFSVDDPQTARRIVREAHPDDRGRVLAAIEHLRTGRDTRVEYRRICPDGAVRRLGVRVSPVTTDDGELVGFVGAVADVTARRAIEEAERMVRSQLQAIFDNSPAVMYLKDTELRYRLVNARFTEMTGRSADEVRGLTDFDFFAPDYAELARLRAHAVLNGDGPHVFEDEIDGDDGKPRHYHSTHFKVHGPDGEVMGIGGLVADVTERKEAEERFRRSFDDAPQGIALADPDGSWMRVNHALAEMLGHPASELVGRSSADFTHPDDLDGDFARIRETVESGQAATREGRLVCRDGSIVWVLTSIDGVRDSRGRLQWLIVHILDITQRKQVEEELQRQQMDMLTIAGVAREAGSSERPADEVCRAARKITHASTVALLEMRGSERLVVSAPLRDDLPIGYEVRIDDAPSGAALCALSRERLFLAEARHHPALSAQLAIGGETRSIVFEPVLRGSEVLGVLMLGWNERRDALTPRESSVIRLLAAEMATTIERSRLTAQLRELARTDPLTGLANRRVWDERIGVELSHARRIGHPVCVALVDLDHFKRYNDTHGHQAGDRLLTASTAAWQDELRTGDLLVRTGGDEFAALLPDCDLEASHALVERLRLSTPSDATCSVGVVQWDGVESPDSLIARADAALYAAKESGRARSVSA